MSNKKDGIASVWEAPGFIAALVAIASAFGGWAMLLPVVPYAVLRDGGSASLAGATTGVFMGFTVCTQIITPKLTRRFGYTPVLVVAAFLLGIPALGHIASVKAIPVLTVSAIRGIGFGALCVAESALIAELVPVRFLGKATALLGVSVGLSQCILLPAGLSVSEAVGTTPVYVATAVISLMSALMCLRIPRLRPQAAPPNKSRFTEDGRYLAPTWKLVLVPALCICTAAIAYGAISSFLPTAVKESMPERGALIGGALLAAVGFAQMISRYFAGVVADKRGVPGATMIPAQILVLIGVILLAVTLSGALPWPWLFVCVLVYGLGYGAIQNESMLDMFTRLPRSKLSEASALWNMSFDSGTGLGSLLLGFVVASSGYVGAFSTAACIVAVALSLKIADTIMGNHRIVEYDNTAARVRQLARLGKRVAGHAPVISRRRRKK